MRKLLLAFVVTMAFAAIARPLDASAHAALLRAEPGENSYVQRAPAEVTLVFSEPVSARQSSIQVLDANGNALVLPPATPFALSGCSPELELLSVCLPAAPPTRLLP